ncbi:MAG: hypothetical protein WDA75_11040 [Candidatus Latescibacterota bacterium]
MVLVLGSLQAQAQPSPLDPRGFLPLSVGNSWTFTHRYLNDRPDLLGMSWNSPAYAYRDDVQIAITHTEQIDGQTYYVFSDLDYDFPPVPSFFLAGKKVRWDEQGRLMVRGQDTEFCLYDFSHEGTYDIPEQEDGVSRCEGAPYGSPPTYYNNFFFSTVPQDIIAGRWVQFAYSFGISYLDVGFGVEDYPVYYIIIEGRRAVIDGQQLEYVGIVRPTGVFTTTWGIIKERSLSGAGKE